MPDPQTAARHIASRLQLSESRVLAVVRLFDDGNTLPFIARYRKEATGGLDETQLRAIEDLLTKFRELEKRKETVLATIESQGQLTDQLKAKIIACDDRQELEDLYLPFKPKRKTRASVAREKGLQPLADILLQQRPLKESRSALVSKFVDAGKGVESAESALQGACDIVAETWAEESELRTWMVERVRRGRMQSKVKRGKKADGEKFDRYFDHSERVDRLPGHRFLAMKRGESEGVLRLKLLPDEDYTLPKLEGRLLQNPRFEFAAEIRDTVQDCYQRLLQPAAQSVVEQSLKEKADTEAIDVFAKNLRELLLAAPAGPRVTLGVDPGFRTGCKLAVVDETGGFVESQTIFPTPPKSDTQTATKLLLDLIQRHNVELIAIGNGTASRETESFVAKVLSDNKLDITRIVVSEAGASVYSASEVAVQEYPQLDVTVRGAISIAHRLQDPLAELVKIDPASIGVGQYQHDVNQTHLRKALQREVESCVNSVGVDVNLASASLLSFVAGIGPKLAQNIVQHRSQNGSFVTRNRLKDVPKLGEKAFQQAAGFLRIRDGSQPLDNSGVHPESYSIVKRMAGAVSLEPASLIGKADVLSKLKAQDFIGDEAGEFTVKDILSELSHPGRDPRSEFKTVTFSEGIDSIEDLVVGMKLDGVITNVTHFGAFVDVGVHQDGLVHVSQLANHFVDDPTKEVSVGDIVNVTVLEVDAQRRRISLSRIAE